MIIVLDLDRTLNLLQPHWIRSVRELAPLGLQRKNGRALWDWLAAHLSDADYAVNHDGLAPWLHALVVEERAGGT